jgi:hypothetical protein
MSIDTNPTTVSIAPDEPPAISFTTPEALIQIISEIQGDALYVQGKSIISVSFYILNILTSLGVSIDF